MSKLSKNECLSKNIPSLFNEHIYYDTHPQKYKHTHKKKYGNQTKFTISLGKWLKRK